MNLSSLLYMALMIIVPAIFIAFFYYRGNKKKEQKMNLLRSFATKGNCTLNQVEEMNNYLLGLDMDKKILFYADLTKNNFQQISLNQLKKSSVKETARVLEPEQGGQKVIEKVDLQLHSIVAQTAPIYWNFFNIDNGKLQLSGEHQFLEKWVSIINKQINAIKQ